MRFLKGFEGEPDEDAGTSEVDWPGVASGETPSSESESLESESELELDEPEELDESESLLDVSSSSSRDDDGPETAGVASAPSETLAP